MKIKTTSLFYSHICAVSENNVIGLKGKLPWNIPEDLKFFKEKTLGKMLIMGRKTFDSLGEPLPGRFNLVITRQKNFQTSLKYLPIWTGGIDQTLGTAGADPLSIIKKSLSLVICTGLKSAMDFCSHPEVLKKYGPEIFIIGGGEIYKQSLPFVKHIYLTRIHKTYQGDAFYPEIPAKKFKEVERKERKERKGQPAYSFITYERRA